MPGLRAALPAALLLLLFLLLCSLPPAAPKLPPWPRTPGRLRALNPSDPRVTRAAWVALHFHNLRSGSPYLVRALRYVLKASGKDIPGIGRRYYLQFFTDFYISGNDARRCLASVLYRKKPPPEVSIKCEHTQDQTQMQEEDKKFYLFLQHRMEPIIAVDIPDSHGNIDSPNVPLWGLILAGSSSIILKKSTEEFGYFMTQIKSVKQRLREDSAVELELVILFHQNPSQEIEVCYMHLFWTLHRPLREKHTCAEYNHRLEDGSGQDSGSAAGMFHEGNF